MVNSNTKQLPSLLLVVLRFLVENTSIGRGIHFLKDLPKNRKVKEYIEMLRDFIRSLGKG